MVMGCLGTFLAAAIAPFACLPKVEGDFEDYQARIASFPKTEVEASTFDGSALTEAEEGLYYGACLSELANGQLSDVFSFYTKTKFVPVTGGGGTLVLSIEALRLEGGDPPKSFSRAGITGGVIPDPALGVPPTAVDATGRFKFTLTTTTVPGDANPISGSNVLIEGATLDGRFGSVFCARLGGEVKQPAAAARTLSEERNICRFFPLADGQPTPVLNIADFQSASCPL